ncbi:MAG: thioredoxin domain-containing protein [Pirellulales bacterium]
MACAQQRSKAEETKKAVDAAAELFGPSAAPATMQPQASSVAESSASPATESTTTPGRDAVEQGKAEKRSQPKSGNMIDSLFSIFSGQSIEDASAAEGGASELEAKPSTRMSIDAIAGLSDSDGDDSNDRVNSRDQVIKVVSGYEEGARLAQLNRRPLLVLLGAEWCVWCRKLEAELETTAAEPILKKWIVCKVDVDKDPDTAAKFEAASLPGLRIVGFDGEVSASREGYLPADELSAWLEQNGDKVDPVMQQLLFAQKRPSASDVKKLVQFLGHRRPAVRSAAQQRLESHVSTSAGGIVDALRGGSLVQRLSALEMLERAGAPVAGLDPWDPKTLDEVDWQPLIAWARQAGEQKGKGKKSNSQPESEENQEQALTPELETSLRGLIDRLLAADGSRREALMVEASSLSTSIIGLTRARLASDSSLTDGGMQALRELMFRAAAGRATRLEFAALLSALARLDVQTRREAALRLASLLSSEDQLLIDELARDSDPVVREAAVAAEFKTGGLRSQTRITQLLSDPDANVRSAVLRVLQEKSSPGAIVAVVDHLDHEPNEDLLVLSVKVAASDKELGVGLDAVLKMLGHEKWRVRAAALDAAKQLTTDGSGFSDDNVLPPAESKKLFTAVLQRIEDSDEFVAASARELLTSIFDGSTADLFLDYLTAHPDQMSRLHGDNHDWSLERRKPHLVSAAAQVLKSGSGKKLETAATLLALLAPENVKFELPKLLGSESNQVRIAGLKSILAIVSLQRAEEVKLGAAAWLVRHNAEKRKHPTSLSPWVPVPESFLKLSGASNGFASDMDRGEEPEAIPDEPQQSIAAAPRMTPPRTVPAISPEREDALNAAADLFGQSASAPIASLPAVVDPTTNKVVLPSTSKDRRWTLRLRCSVSSRGLTCRHQDLRTPTKCNPQHQSRRMRYRWATRM